MTRVPWKTNAVEEAEVDVEELVAELLSKVVAVTDGPMITVVVEVRVLKETDVSVMVLGLELLVKYSPYPEAAIIARTTRTTTKLLDAMASLR